MSKCLKLWSIDRESIRSREMIIGFLDRSVPEKLIVLVLILKSWVSHFDQMVEGLPTWFMDWFEWEFESEQTNLTLGSITEKWSGENAKSMREMLQVIERLGSFHLKAQGWICWHIQGLLFKFWERENLINDCVWTSKKIWAWIISWVERWKSWVKNLITFGVVLTIENF